MEKLQRSYTDKEIFIGELMMKYELLYDGVQPIPYIRDRLYCIDRVFVEGGIEYLGEHGFWRNLGTYQNIFKDARVKSRRRIVEGDSGYGKSALALQLAYDWCNKVETSALSKVDILILLQLRQLGGVTSIYRAIKHFLLPIDSRLTESDIANIILKSSSVVMVLDGFDEYPDRYNGSNSDVISIISGDMFQQCEVILTTRSLCVPNRYPPQTKRIRLTGFDDRARDHYIRKAVVGDDERAAENLKKRLKDNAVLAGLCQVPLFFVMVAHMSHESELFQKFNSDTIFFRYMISGFHSHMKNKMKDKNVRKFALFETDHRKLGRIAFEGLSRKEQQIVWKKERLCERLGQEFYNQYVSIGILVEEEVLAIRDEPTALISEYIQYETEVRFYHKLFCEWYAAHYLAEYASKDNVTFDTPVGQRRYSTSSESNAWNTDPFLRHLDPINVQFLYRFACGLNPVAGSKIIEYLKQSDEGEKFAVLCTLETEGNDEKLLKTVAQLFSSQLTIKSDDNLLLQRSTIQLLEIASCNVIPISSVCLGPGCLKYVNETQESLLLSSDVHLPKLDTLQELVIDDISDLREMATDVLAFAAKCSALKTLKFVGSVLLPLRFYNRDVLARLLRNQLKVVWAFQTGPRAKLLQLNLELGRWEGTVHAFNHMKEILVSTLQQNDSDKLVDYFGIHRDQLESIKDRESLAKTLLNVLEEKRIISPSNVTKLEAALSKLSLNPSLTRTVNEYQYDRDQPTLYDRFLATISVHFTSSLIEDLCSSFTKEEKDFITSSEKPALSLLEYLDEKNIIQSSDVGALRRPFLQARLVQSVAKIDEYESLVNEERYDSFHLAVQTVKAKKKVFVECLKSRMKSWYETMAPVPWKKSCRWRSADLFVGSGLILTSSKTKRTVKDIDERCKLQYHDIFSGEDLQSELRIIIEGDPGSGKTMLSYQLAYDWSQDKITNVDIFILLPLKYVEEKTLVKSIKELYIPASRAISENDIEAFLSSETGNVCLLLDGYEEYNPGSGLTNEEPPAPEVVKVMNKDKYPYCKVIVTCRSDFAKGLPPLPMLKVGMFGENERNAYIENLELNKTKKQQVKRIIEGNSFILDLCSLPLLFVLSVHNIESMEELSQTQLNKVTPFVKTLILKLCSTSELEKDIDNLNLECLASLGKVSFNGLCKGYQQLSWQEEFMENNVRNFKEWIDCGILLVEEDIRKEERNEQGPYEFPGKDKHKENQSKISNEKIASAEGPPVDPLKEEKENIEASSKPLQRIKSRLWKLLSPLKRRAEKEDQAKEESNKLLPRYESNIAKSSAKATDENIPERNEYQQNVDEQQIAGKGYRAVHCNPKEVPLVVKFLHKIFQEWFAATYFCFITAKLTTECHSKETITSQLLNISPTDLHYVLRFSCYFHPPMCHVIMKHLLTSNRTASGNVPQNIMDYIFLCFIEHHGDRGSDIRDTVTEVCKEPVIIHSQDSRLLKKAKTTMLEYAAISGIVIENLELVDVILAVDKEALTLDADVRLEPLNTLRKVKVSRWDRHLSDDDCQNILQLLTKGKETKKIVCTFPHIPVDIQDQSTLGNVQSKNIEVKWIIGSTTHILDSKSGTWVIAFGGTAEESLVKGNTMTSGWETSRLDSELFKEKFINEEGGTLFLPEAEVGLEIPPAALTSGHNVQIRVPLDYDLWLPCSEVSPRVTPLIICEPDGLEFLLPVKLTLPHCAVIHNPEHHTVSVKFGKKNKKTNEWTWKPENVVYTLSQKSCSIFFRHFTGVDASIGSTKEKILRVIPYAKLRSHTNTLALTLWFCNDLESDFQSVLRCGENDRYVPLDSYDTFRLRYLEEDENVNVTLIDVWNQWNVTEPEKSIAVRSLSHANKLYRDFRLRTACGQDSDAYIYLLLRVTQNVGETQRETEFAIRKRFVDLTRPFSLSGLYSTTESDGSASTSKEHPPDMCTAVPYIDPMKHCTDDIILTLWICPFDSKNEKIQRLQKEQTLQLKHMVKSENSFALSSERRTVTAITRFFNGSWNLTPDVREVETERIRFGSRVKFQFIGKKKEKDETKCVDLEVTFQDEREKITFIEEVEMDQLLFESKRLEPFRLREELSCPQQEASHEASVTALNMEQLPESSQSKGVSSNEAKAISNAPSSQGGVRGKGDKFVSMFQFLKRELALKWRDVGRYLGISDGQIDGFRVTYRDNIEEGIYQMFHHWKQEKGNAATTEDIKDALRRAGRQDLADKIENGEHLQ